MVTKQVWGRYQDKDIMLYTLSNKKGTSVSISEFGGAVVSLYAKDRDGILDDIILGYDSLDEYISDRYYMGTILGRCANRIKNPDFLIGDKPVNLSQNQGAFHLHGGAKGFHKCCWNGQIVDDCTVALQRVCPDGEEGYPGNLYTTVMYSLSDKDEFSIRYVAVTDQDTIVSLSNHSYFNLSGHSKLESIENDEVIINADYFVQIDSDCGSTGAILPVGGTPLYMKTPAKLGKKIKDVHEQITLGSGFNHTFVLKRTARHAVTVWNKKSGRRMDVFTDQPGVHLYTSNYLNDMRGKKRKLYSRYGAMCFETQNYPEAINMPHFPSPILKQGEIYNTTTTFKFSTFL